MGRATAVGHARPAMATNRLAGCIPPAVPPAEFEATYADGLAWAISAAQRVTQKLPRSLYGLKLRTRLGDR